MKSPSSRLIFEDFLFHLYPTPCLLCEKNPSPFGQGLCASCHFQQTRISPWQPDLCRQCGQALPFQPKPAGSSEDLAEYCCHCQREKPLWQSLRSIALYSGAMKKLIQAYKFHGNRPLAKPLGEMLLSPAKPPWRWSEISALIPVPMHRKRFIERGFDHTLLLSRQLRRALHRNRNIKIPLEASVLRVKTAIEHQTGASRKERRKNLKGAFEGKFKKRFKGQKRSTVFLLIDDVVTTGATLSSCARTLRQTYPDCTLHCLTLARTPLPQDGAAGNFHGFKEQP